MIPLIGPDGEEYPEWFHEGDEVDENGLVTHRLIRHVETGWALVVAEEIYQHSTEDMMISMDRIIENRKRSLAAREE